MMVIELEKGTCRLQNLSAGKASRNQGTFEPAAISKETASS
jgi:hypothetical protein